MNNPIADLTQQNIQNTNPTLFCITNNCFDNNVSKTVKVKTAFFVIYTLGSVFYLKTVHRLSKIGKWTLFSPLFLTAYKHQVNIIFPSNNPPIDLIYEGK